MENHVSTRVYSAWLEGTTKFDYYIVGLVVALVAYWGKDLQPLTRVFGRETFSLLGVLLLLSSAYLGLKRIETTLAAIRANYEHLDTEARADPLAKAIQQGGALIDKNSMKAMDRETAEKYLDGLKHRMRVIGGAFEKLSTRGTRLYTWRNITLAVGVAILIACKVWP